MTKYKRLSLEIEYSEIHILTQEALTESRSVNNHVTTLIKIRIDVGLV